MIDIDAVRADTPACEKLVHFNNAGASLMPSPVFNAVNEHLRLEFDIGGYEAAKVAAATLGNFYTQFAALLGCNPQEIAYVENATRAWDMAFYGIPLEKGDRVLTHESEYSSNYLAMLHRARQRGLEIDLVPSDASGQIDVDALESMIGPRTRLIALTHVPTQGGLVNPAVAVGQIARKHDLIYMLDACQSVGQVDIDVKEIGCHVLSGTGRKFLRGPRGTGFLYVTDDSFEHIEPAFIDLHAATWIAKDRYELAAGARRFETWESYVAGKIGLGVAVSYARKIGLPIVEERVRDLAATLRTALAHLPGISVHDLGARKCGIVTFEKEDESAAGLSDRLRAKGINLSFTDMPSARLDFERRGLNELVRASVHYFNTENEIDYFVEILRSG